MPVTRPAVSSRLLLSVRIAGAVSATAIELPPPAEAPPEEPPAFIRVSHGLRVEPKTRLVELPPAPNSGVLVLPMTMPPRDSSRSTIGSLVAGMWSFSPSVAKVLRTPLTLERSLIPMGSPASQPASRAFRPA